jgi:hypothetical protein
MLQSFCLSVRAFHWKKLRSLGWEVNYVEPGITEAMPEKREPGEPAEDANYSTVDDDFVSIVEEIIAHRV